MAAASSLPVSAGDALVALTRNSTPRTVRLFRSRSSGRSYLVTVALASTVPSRPPSSWKVTIRSNWKGTTGEEI
jgi:hypothetical protein